MGRQRTVVRVNQFVGGFNTEANPLNFPQGASFDEQNCDLLGDGSRKRRNGFDTDFGTPVNIPSGAYPSGERLGKNQYLWTNAGGFPETSFIVVQLGNYIGIHLLDETNLSDNLVFSYVFTDAARTQTFGFTSIDGILVVVTGTGPVHRVEYNGTTFTVSTSRLLIRDLFGVQSGTLTDAQNIQVRPSNINSTHIYNLRNQTFALPKANGDIQEENDPNKITVDPIAQMKFKVNLYPSNADNVNLHLFADANFEENRTVERFRADSMHQTPPNNSRAPFGYFIIDALDRGESREEAFETLTSRQIRLQWFPTVSLPTDRTPGGATTVAQYSGRVWYAGFKGEVQGADKRSPKMSSYVLFSQVVKEPSQISWCYQEADPTSHIDPDLVDTDGGFIKIDGAYGIKALVPADTSLFVFAENGVWRIVGDSENNFSATSYSVAKVNDKGCVSPGSVVYVDGLLIYWSDSAIFAIQKGDVGVWEVQDITDQTIKTFYQTLSPYEKATSSGYYDDVTNTIRWLYGEDPEVRSEVGELILNKKFQVFTKNKINLPSGVFGPITVSGGKTGNSIELPVTVGGEVVTVDGEVVTTPSLYNISAASQNLYCILTRLYPTIEYVFGGYNNFDSAYDWTSISAVDSPSYLTTGFVTGGDGRLRKDIPYVTTYFEIIEGLDSSCFLQSRWDWTLGATSGQWSNPRQIYRDIKIRNEDSTVITRNKIRGIGRAAALNFGSEEGKFFHIYGWEHNLDATTDE